MHAARKICICHAYTSVATGFRTAALHATRQGRSVFFAQNPAILRVTIAKEGLALIVGTAILFRVPPRAHKRGGLSLSEFFMAPGRHVAAAQLYLRF
jgi:hypothetical protein